ncbi:unnamed protein product [Rotaria socialis]
MEQRRNWMDLVGSVGRNHRPGVASTGGSTASTVSECISFYIIQKDASLSFKKTGGIPAVERTLYRTRQEKFQIEYKYKGQENNKRDIRQGDINDKHTFYCK